MVTKPTSSARKTFLYTFLSICIIALAAFGVIKTGQLADTRDLLASTQNEITGTKADLSSTQGQLITTEAELSQTEAEITEVQTELSDTQNELQDTNLQLKDTTSQLTQAQADNKNAAEVLAAKQALTTTLQDGIDNLQVNQSRLTTGYGYELKNPTYRECKAFMAADKTNSHAYVIGSYIYSDFVDEIKTNAMKQKIRCAFVSVHFAGGGAPYIIAFETTDKGMVYFEPTTDEEVKLEIGKQYWTECVIANPSHYYIDPEWDDTVAEVFIVW
jgi:Skp family chaperone for outer membrane proteins